jgi:DNA repair exonuclease SbcCD nuclease subunit
MNIVYSGSIERVDFSEASEKKYFIDIKEEYGNLIWNAVELDVRPMEIISLDTRGRSLNYVYDELKKRKIINALVKLTLKVGNKERELMKPENIIDYLNKLGAYDVRLDYELMSGEITMADETSKSDLETLFKEYVKNTVDPEIRDAVIERGLKLLKENLES